MSAENILHALDRERVIAGQSGAGDMAAFGATPETFHPNTPNVVAEPDGGGHVQAARAPSGTGLPTTDALLELAPASPQSLTAPVVNGGANAASASTEPAKAPDTAAAIGDDPDAAPAARARSASGDDEGDRIDLPAAVVGNGVAKSAMTLEEPLPQVAGLEGDPARMQALVNDLQGQAAELIQMASRVTSLMEQRAAAIEADMADTIGIALTGANEGIDAAGDAVDGVSQVVAARIEAVTDSVTGEIARVGDTAQNLTADVAELDASALQLGEGAVAAAAGTSGGAVTAVAGLAEEAAGSADIVGSDIAGGIATIAGLLEGDTHYEITDTETGETLLSSGGAPATTFEPPIGNGGIADALDDGLAPLDPAPAGSLLGLPDDDDHPLDGLLGGDLHG